jgi:formylglycine-generating enzyme required for sulfatase activity
MFSINFHRSGRTAPTCPITFKDDVQMKKVFSTLALSALLIGTAGGSFAQGDNPAVTKPTAADVGGEPKAGQARNNRVDGAEMVYIPAGAFQMGDDDIDAIKRGNPRHTVKLSGYWMYKNLVTVGQYKTFCKATKRRMPPEPAAGNIVLRGYTYVVVNFNPNWSKESHPIVNVTYDDATAYAEWAKGDLPTEAQWEKAARGTAGGKYPWGDKFGASKLWCSRTALFDAGGTHSVGVLGVSPYGCTDMAGNVSQWCKDWYNADFWKGPQAGQIDPDNQTVGEKKYRVLRGGSWGLNNQQLFRASLRDWTFPTGWAANYGFRCAVRSDSP